MSAYVVDTETVDRIIWALRMCNTDRAMHWPRLGDRLSNLFLGNDEEQAVNTAAFGQELLAMNVAAVEARYNERDPEPEYTQVRACVGLTPVQAYKSVSCYLYQCSEGDVPEWPLYQVLREWQSDLAHMIVANLPEYKNGSWA